MSEFYSLTVPSETYNIEITNEEIKIKVDEISLLRENIMKLNENIQTMSDRLSEATKALLVLYLQQRVKPFEDIKL